MKKYWAIPVLIMMVAVMVLPTQVQAEVKIGVLAKRGAPKCMQKWGPTGAYLTEQLGDKVTIVPLKFVEINPAVAGGKVDFVLANSAFYVELEKSFGVHAVATLINSRKGNALSEFGGVILVKQDSPIQTLADVAGKKFMTVKKSSFGGSQMAWRLLMDNGIDPDKDCASVAFGKKHDNVVMSVLHGMCDVGTVRSDTMERMADEGTINMADFRIINQVDDDFPFVHSTRLYPEWPIAATKRADPIVAQKLAAALLAMSQDDAAAKSAKIVGWATPADYTAVRECLQTIQYGAFAVIQ
jgi:two-component system, LuxR family, sensor histidine kinase TtrS